MKKQILFILVVLLPMMASAQNSVKIDDIYYKLFPETQEAEVIFMGRWHYVGDVVIPPAVVYNDVEYHVTSIKTGAFSKSSELTSVTIPYSVTNIGNNLFSGCTSLTSIVIDEENPVYDSRENCNAIIETANNKLLLGCKGSMVPNSVTSIGKGAFAYCLNLATVIIPESITHIGDYAFIFSGLKDMFCYAEQLPEIGSDIFQETYYKETLHVPADALDAYRNAEQWKDFENIVALTDDDPNPTGIIVPSTTQQPMIVDLYDLSGRRTSQPQRGVIIVKMNNGTTKKVVVK